DDELPGTGGATPPPHSPHAVPPEAAVTHPDLQAVLDAVPGGVSWIRADLTYLGVNPHLAHLFRHEPPPLIRQPVGFLEGGPAFADFVRDFFASSATGSTREMAVHLPPDVEATYLLMAQKYQQGEAAVFVGIDITQQKRATAALQQSELHNRRMLET